MQVAVTRRGIDFIWHFTRLENLDSILRNGIIPRARLQRQGIPSTYNDAHRIDGQPEASCFSIGHPNYKMFYSLRMQSPETRWAVIGCSSSVLWTKRCAFCHENAASANVTNISIEDRMSVEAFERIFLPIEGKPSRQALGLTDKYPTHPQAEVLVFDTVEPALIVGAVCQDAATAATFSHTHPTFRLIHDNAHFSPRSDYQHWRQCGQ